MAATFNPTSKDGEADCHDGKSSGRQSPSYDVVREAFQKVEQLKLAEGVSLQQHAGCVLTLSTW